jgi:septum formation protein
MQLILASASPRRAELLAAAGFTFETLVVQVNESVRPGETPVEHVRRLAAEKSAAAWKAHCLGRPVLDMPEHHGARASRVGVGPHASDIVLGADTVVVVDGEILGKPKDDDDAQRMLRRLSGRDHVVLTGVSLRTEGREWGAVDETRVWFAPLGDADIEWYVQTGEGRDKAGAYGIQGAASRFIPRIDGSYANVVGLPVALVAKLIGAAVASVG